MTIIICFVLDGPVSNNSGSSLDSSVIIAGVMGVVILLLIIIEIVYRRHNRKGTPPVDNAIIHNNPNVNNLSHGVSTGEDRAATSSCSHIDDCLCHHVMIDKLQKLLRHSHLLHQNTAANITTSTSDTEIQLHVTVDQSHNTQTTCTPHSLPAASNAKSYDDHGYEYDVNQPKSDDPTNEKIGNANHAAVDQSHMHNTQTIHSPFITNSAKPNDGDNYKYGVVNQPKSDDPNFFKSTI